MLENSKRYENKTVADRKTGGQGREQFVILNRLVRWTL